MKIAVSPLQYRASVRLTHHYVEGWRHLDRYADRDWTWHILGTARRHQRDADSSVVVYTIRASRPVGRNEMTRVMAAAFNRGCQCEHDCCGHVQWSVMSHRVRRFKRHEWHIPVAGIRNL